MLSFTEIKHWTELFELCNNRIVIINQLLGETFQQHVMLRYSSGRYRCLLGESLICSFRVYDVPGTDAAFHSLDAWADCVWHLSRSGALHNTLHTITPIDG